MNGGDRALHRLSWGWIVLGALVLAMGLLLAAAAWQFYRESTLTSGIVVAHEGRDGGIRDLAGRYVSSNVVPVVAYRGADGLAARVIGNMPQDESKAPPIGGPLVVRHRVLADGTTMARIDSPFEIMGLPALLLLLGTGLLGAGLYGRRVAVGRQSVRGRPDGPGMADWDRLRLAAGTRARSPALRGGAARKRTSRRR